VSDDDDDDDDDGGNAEPSEDLTNNTAGAGEVEIDETEMNNASVTEFNDSDEQ